MILVTGATGYIGGRLVPALLEKGYNVAVMARDTRRIVGRPWEKSVEIREGDLTRPETLEKALAGIHTAYYLIHSMYHGPDFVELDRLAVHNFVDAGRHLQHVIYLGGLLPAGLKVSNHLRSRAEVGRVLRESLPTTEFRAGPIIGSGSASFELVRYLTQRIPIFLAPTWMRNEVQPIGIRDILSYLLAAYEREPLGVVEVGSDRLTFRQMIEDYADERQLMKRRFVFFPPFLPPRIAARWLTLLTPIPASLAIPLIEGINKPVVADTTRAREIFPTIEPMPYRQALKLALERIRQLNVVTRWSGAQGDRPTYALTDEEGLISEVRSIHTAYPPEAVFKSICSLGGKRGWLVWRWAWEIRGLLDKLAGGPGLRRGRRHPTALLPGEALDFWRVEEIDEHRRLLLRAEMRVPGQAWIQWEVFPENNGTRIIQKALFAPRGLLGVLYWYSLYPVHKFIFSDMVEAITRDARLFLGEECVQGV